MNTATLADGRKVEYIPDAIAEGAMKKVYFTSDRSSVLCFYKDEALATDPNRLNRLEAILGRYNPTSDRETGEYWQNLFCWCTGIVTHPQLGIMTPTYPQDFFFTSGFCQGKEKESTWFIREKLRGMLPSEERGTWIDYLNICILLARAVRRLHQAGLAHSDLSNKNVLIDPAKGKCLIIDIDSLVVPSLYPPDVLGTRGYIAPEVLATVHLPVNSPQRKHVSTRTDLHALAVLIYQYLFQRHPLEGPKINSTVSAEADDRLSMGEKALFIEHPRDRSNRPEGIHLPYTAFGSHLSRLFEQAFIEGLHSPEHRPTAMEWERGLTKTWDFLVPCQNPQCSGKWFVLERQDRARCPFCGRKQQGTIPHLILRSQRRPGQWLRDGSVMAYDRLSLFKWHVFDHIPPGEKCDRAPQAYCTVHQGRWWLANQQLTSLTASNGQSVPLGNAIALKHGQWFQLSREPHGRIVEVEMLCLD